ncbi:MAG TPA: sensor histidine kinase [Bacteroidia bacterium]|nr:sensor histidine kinase [Bacteroidia bacterium]HNU32579.1 sensor histidine kinase [Bacteroidia bacterium]
MRNLFLCLCVCFVVPLNAQDMSIIDSLKKAEKNATIDTVKIKLLYDICWQYIQSKPDTGLAYANDALEKSKNVKFNFGIAKGYIMKGIHATIVGNYNLAIENYLLCKEVHVRQKDSVGIAAVLNNIGNVYLYKGDYNKAIDYYLQSVKIEERHVNPERLGSSYMNLGGLFYQLEKHQTAMPYFRKCFEVTKNLSPQPQYIAMAYNSIGKIHAATNNADSALISYNMALPLAIQTGDKNAEAASYEGIAGLYVVNKKYKEALGYYLKAEKLLIEIGNADALSEVTKQTSHVYFNLGLNDDAIKKAHECLELSLEIGAKKTIAGITATLANAYEKEGNFTKALQYQKLSKAYNDSLLDETSNRQIEELRTQYETEKKETENKILTVENNRKDTEILKSRNEKIFLLAAIGLILITGWFAWMHFKLKQQKAHQQELMRQKEIRSQAVIDAEEKERQRIGKDLHDGVGQLLSAARMNVTNLENIFLHQPVQQQINFKNAVDLIDESVKEVRAISHNMMPNMLIKSGLVKAVREFIDKISSTGKLKIELQTIGLDQRLNLNTENILFRVLQEIVNNIIKHARATEVSIQLIRHDNEMVLMVEDNGVGFDAKKIRMFDGIGLKNIQSRVEYLNGTVDFDSQPGKGTTVNIQVPVA